MSRRASTYGHELPCITSETAEKVSDENLTINPVEIDGECQFDAWAGQEQSVTTRVGYKANVYRHRKVIGLALRVPFTQEHRQVKLTGKGYTLNLGMWSSLRLADAQVRSAMLKDPQASVGMDDSSAGPEQVDLTQLGCVMEGTFSCSTATLKPSAVLPAGELPDGRVSNSGELGLLG